MLEPKQLVKTVDFVGTGDTRVQMFKGLLLFIGIVCRDW